MVASCQLPVARASLATGYWLLATLFTLPVLAQHDISKVDPAPPDSAIATPLPDGRRMKKYDIPDLAGAKQALGSQLIDGRLPKPLIDYFTREGSIEQRVSIFEGGLVVLNMTGAATIRKRLIIPAETLKIYLAATSPAKLRNIDVHSLAAPETTRRSMLRVYDTDGTHVERAFHPASVLPKPLNDLVLPMRDLVRAMSEDRTITSTVAGYEPKAGDELVADDHKTWRVVRVVDAGVVELKCLDAPTTMYVAKQDLHLYFIGAKGNE